jgi:hypothetical protein
MLDASQLKTRESETCFSMSDTTYMDLFIPNEKRPEFSYSVSNKRSFIYGAVQTGLVLGRAPGNKGIGV